MGAKMATRQWADVDSDEENEITKKHRSLRNPVNLAGGTGPETVTDSSIFEDIRMRASNADNTVSDGRYGRDQDERDTSPRGGFRQEDSGPNFPRGQQFQNRDDQYAVRALSIEHCLLDFLSYYHIVLMSDTAVIIMSVVYFSANLCSRLFCYEMYDVSIAFPYW